jgi:hypothetical protein
MKGHRERRLDTPPVPGDTRARLTTRTGGTRMIEATTRCLSAVVLGTAMLVGAVRAEAAEIQNVANTSTFRRRSPPSWPPFL